MQLHGSPYRTEIFASTMGAPTSSADAIARCLEHGHWRPVATQPPRELSPHIVPGVGSRYLCADRRAAEKLGLDAEAVASTVARFNGFADAGVDEDFQRGAYAVDRYYTDRRVTPNPSLRALRKAPYYAIPVFPGDLGTKGGLVTDAAARVLDQQGQPIAGLYAAGNTSSAVMGPSYPGAGGTIGPALCFGFLAAEAAAEAAVTAEAASA